jgi:cell division septum initiation protein DivIVA
MHRRRHRHRGFGRPHGLGRGWYDREKVLERLEDYQRDLEQELADVSDLIKRLKAGEQEAETATV